MTFPTPPAILSFRDLAVAELENASVAVLQRLYAWMHLARTADNRILDLFRQGLIKGTVTGGQGNEGLIVPLALLADKTRDVISFSHRGLGGHLVWSGHLCDHLNQYFANAASPTKAREGNIHHGDPRHRSIPMISHLGTMGSCVLGAVDAQRREGLACVGFAFMGDGSSSTGDVHEAMNLASVLSLPIVFVIENNGYAYSTPTCEQYATGVELWKRAEGYGMKGHRIDCSDALEAARTLATLIADTRANPRPCLVEAQTFRLRGHAAYDTCDYLRPGESEAFFAREPLPRLRERLTAMCGESAVAALDAELDAFIEACLQASLAIPRPSPAGMDADLYAPAEPARDWRPSLPVGQGSRAADGAEIVTFAQAINRALRKILTEEPRALVLGQDIATYGGAFKVTEGLFAEFGRSRVCNTPLAESACTGYSIGLALAGHRPILEFQFADFATEATTQIALNAATFHFRSGASVPLVLRLPCGGGLTFGSFHSQELESLFLACPGLKALYPSTPQDACNAILAAYEDPNPVLVFEHKGLYRRGKAPIRWDPDYRSVWTPRLVREGDYATLVTYGEMVSVAEEAATYFAEEYERSIEVWDLRCLSPLRLERIEASLARTHRLIVLHEGRRTHGFGAELVSRLVEKHFFDLEARPLRMASLDLPVPFAPELEQAFRPTRDSVVEAIAAWMG